MTIKRCVIIGAGYAGVKAATELEKLCSCQYQEIRIILIDKNDYMYTSVGSVRACVDPSFIPTTTIPLTSIFKNTINKVVHASVVSIHKDYIMVD